MLLLCGAGAFFGASALFQMEAWNKLDVDRITQVDQSLLLYDRNGVEITSLHKTEDRLWISINEIPLQVRNAFIAAEDARFYDHIGVDFVRIAGAAWADIKAGSYVQGASTISQQLIKLSHLSSEKEMSRKLEEAVLAYQLEQRYSKDEILEMYLNYVYFGGGFYGVEAAARGYFGVHANELTVAQSAQLAGILKSPSRFSPHLKPEASKGRRDVVLGLMQEYGYLTVEECQKAKAEKVELKYAENAEKRGYYVDLALTDACGILNVSMDTLLSGGYRIYTEMDSALQTECENIFADDRYFPITPGQESPEGALVIVNVKNGGVCALMGGRENTVALAYNRATRIRRQPGSVIKPVIVYAPALEAGFTAATMLLDDQINFNGYQPNNFSNTFSGWVTMREAVTKSLNVPAVTVMAEVGVEKSKRFAERVGVSFDERDKSLALALGGFTYGVSPYQIAGAYAAFANGGVYTTPGLIARIEDAEGNAVYQRDERGIRVMSRGNAYILTSMLESVVTDGTGKRLSELNIPIAGKTGTSGTEKGNRDIWMAAYNPEYAAAVWIGYDADNGGLLPEHATGGTYPATILRAVYASLYPQGDAPDFAVPSNVKRFRIDRYTLDTEHVAVLANALTPETDSYSEVFVAGTEPEELTSYWKIPSPPETLTATVGAQGVTISFTPENRMILYRLYRETADGKSVMLSEFTGTVERVSYVDAAVRRKNEYTYYVIPVHPKLNIGGEQVTGTASVKVHIRIG